MNVTNKLNLPQPIVDAVKNDPYTKGDADYSITGLLKPARISELERRHQHDIEEDIADRLFSLQGQVVHGILERSERVAFAEERFFANIAGKRISGQVDRLVLFSKPNLLQDYKFVTLWKFQDGVPEEFEAQTNCYNWLLKKNGFEVDALQIVAIYRDWSKPKARRDSTYPQHGVGVFDVKMWSDEETEYFIKRRVFAHETAKELLPPCSPEDRWASPDTWAVVKPGGKRAARIYLSQSEAQEHVAAFSGKGYVVEFRKGENKRCVDYCRVAPFCEQFKQLSLTGES